MSQKELFSSGAREPVADFPAEDQQPDEGAGDGATRTIPLAARMRPRDLSEYIGQSHLLGPGALLRRSIEADRVQSLILYGPPGTGKTTLAQIIARASKAKFERLSGVESNVGDMRSVLKGAANRLVNTGRSTLLFVDEIHRFNKSQQDILLPDVETGAVKLIGATTHNPCFFVNAPLVSRSQIFELKPLTESDLPELIQRAIKDEDRGLGSRRIRIEDDACRHLVRTADGDARKALNSLEIAALTTGVSREGEIVISLKEAEECIQRKAVNYDRDGDAHYDTVSAFIKSMRGSDPDAAVYWLAKMIHAGEDPRFITRRLLICAAEDVGLADPMALVLATSAHQAAEFVGWPEARIPIAEATIYIATAYKSNSAMAAIDAALEEIKKNPTLPVPAHLRDGHYRGAESLGHGVGYQYSHDFPGNYVPQEYLGAELELYLPGEQGAEKRIRERMEYWKTQKEKRQSRSSTS